jgi:hypothetical protein
MTKTIKNRIVLIVICTFAIILILLVMIQFMNFNSSIEPKVDISDSPPLTSSENNLTPQEDMVNRVVNVKFSVRSDPPLLKKVAQYNSGIPPLEHYERDLSLLQEINAQSFRVDLGMGADGFIASEVVTGTPDDLEYQFENIEKLSRMLNDQNVLPYYSWAYVPYPLQRENDFRKLDTTIPNWQSLWNEMTREFSRKFLEKGIRVGYHEIYNEPDLKEFFFLEPFSTYLDLYRYGSRGIREGNPDAMVGGPALAFPESKSNTMDFLKMVDKEELPLDFFSFHHYWESTSFMQKLYSTRQLLSWYDRFKTTEIHVNEISYVAGWQGEESLNNYYGIAPKMFDVINEVLKASDITLLHWAQFMESTYLDDSYGIIHRNGHKKAAYNVFKIYADMPEERVAVDWNGDRVAEREIGVLASSNKQKASTVLWNRTDNDQEVTVILDQLPFDNGSFRLYRIDGSHSSFFDGASEDLEVVELAEVSTEKLEWKGIIPANGTVYLTLDDGSSNRDFLPQSSDHFTAQDIRTHYYFEDRKKDNYSYFDRKTWRFFLGMGSQDSARSLVGVSAEEIPETLHITTSVSGNLSALSKRSAMIMRLDYYVGDEFTTSVAFHDGLYPTQNEDSFPFGTLKTADALVEVNDFQAFSIDPRLYAPEYWENGRVLISFELSDSGPETRLEISLR